MNAKKLFVLIVLSIVGCGGSKKSGNPVDARFEPPLDAASPDTRESPIPDAPADVRSLIDSFGAGFEHPLDAAAPDTREGVIADATADVLLPIDTITPGDSCQLPIGLSFEANQTLKVPGSIASYTESYHLDNTGLLITRNLWNGYDAEFRRTCTPVLPVCGLPDQITLGNIVADLAAPDVKAALAAPPYTTFGAVNWPSDAWYIAKDGATGHITVGLPCTVVDAGSCQPIPAGLERLKNDLQVLAAAGAAQGACVDLLKP
jgi:hypothetical protein